MTRTSLLLIPAFLALSPAVGCDRGRPPGPPAAQGAKDAHAEGDGHGHGVGAHAQDDGHGHAAGRAPAAGAEEHGEQVKLTGEMARQAGIRIEPARVRVLVDTVHAPARVAFNAERMAHVGSPLSGRVYELKVRIGDRVTKGDPLLIIQSPDLGEAQSDYLLKRMNVEIAIPAVDIARAAHERAKALHAESQGIALTEVQKREAEYKTALGALLSARAQATAAENRLHLFGMDQEAVRTMEKSKEIAPYYAVRAPISGQVIEREVTLGELVNPDREALMVLADMSTLWVLADVPESRLSHVAVGARAQVTVPALPGKSLGGTVTFISPTVDPNTRTVPVRIEVEGNEPGLRPGMFAEAMIAEAGHNGKHEPVLAIPEEATQLVEGEIVVFVPVPGRDNTFAKRPIRVGPAVGRLLPVLSGLEEGESFVAAGSFILKAEHGKSGAEHEH